MAEEIKYTSSPPDVFSGKGVLKICSKFTAEHPWQCVISTKLRSNFTEIALRHGCSPVYFLHIFRTPFPKNTFEWRNWAWGNIGNISKIYFYICVYVYIHIYVDAYFVEFWIHRFEHFACHVLLWPLMCVFNRLILTRSFQNILSLV